MKKDELTKLQRIKRRTRRNDKGRMGGGACQVFDYEIKASNNKIKKCC